MRLLAFFFAFFNAGCAAAGAWVYAESGNPINLVVMVFNTIVAMVLFALVAMVGRD